jgi:AcrR family transcriptional regulator
MARTADEDRRDLHREKIVVAASQLFRSRGFNGTSMRAISDSLKVTAPFIYYHFATKQDLYYACLQRGLVELEASSKAASTEGPIPERFAALVESIARWQIRNPGEGSALLSNAGPEHAPNRHVSAHQRKQLLTVQRRYFNLLKSAIEEGQAAGLFRVLDSTVTTFAILAIGDHVPRWYRVGGRLDIEQIVALNVQLAMRLVGFAQTAARPKSVRKSSIKIKGNR